MAEDGETRHDYGGRRGNTLYSIMIKIISTNYGNRRNWREGIEQVINFFKRDARGVEEGDFEEVRPPLSRTGPVILWCGTG